MKRPAGSTRRDARRRRLRHSKYLRKYGYVQEWQLEMWRFRQKKLRAATPEAT